MARRNGFFMSCLAFIGVAAIAFVAYMYALRRTDEQGGKDNVSTDTWLTVIETDVEYRNESKTVDMLKGVVKTNEQVEKIYVNVNGLGVQYLEFTPSLTQTENSTYISHTITPKDGLCVAGVTATQTVTVDLYVEYGGRSFKVDTQKVALVSSEFKVISAEIEYAENSSTVDLNKGVIKANAQIDKVFVNINGVGVEDLTFTGAMVATENGAYYEYEITAESGLCATAFGADGDVNVMVYVESGGRTYKIDEQTVAVKSCWTKNY